jgi:hypothetical protein
MPDSAAALDPKADVLGYLRGSPVEDNKRSLLHLPITGNLPNQESATNGTNPDDNKKEFDHY